ncbi:MAG: hypothetical protein EPN26_08885 [Rhodospirillales bacterium]|nr:MAG: hypothetical protein EPN26_08885 [Rhodospirillales bacterium]
MSISLCFVILTVMQYRTLGSVIERAIDDRRFSPSLLLLSRSVANSVKSYQTPTADNLPERLKGRIDVMSPKTVDDVFIGINTADMLVSTVGPAFLKRSLIDIFGPLPDERVLHTPMAAVFDTHHSIRPDHDFFGADLSFWPSETYFGWAAEFFPQERDSFRVRAHCVGYPKGDHAFLPECRQKAPGTATVLYIPDALRLKNDPLYLSPWHEHIWCQDRLFYRLAALLKGRLGFANALNLWRHRSLSHAAMIRALRSFCDSNGARLLMAPRRRKDCAGKKTLTLEEEEAMDELLEGGVEYPQSMLTAMKSADLVISGYRSESLLDALAAGTPYVTLTTPVAGLSPFLQVHAVSFDAQRSHFPGANWNVSVGDFITKATALKLSDFRIEPVALAERRAELVGPVDGKVADRILDAVADRLAS